MIIGNSISIPSLTLNNSVSAPSFLHTKSFEFDGLNEVICSPVTPSVVLTGAFSLVINFKTSDTKGYQNLSARDDTGSNRQFILTLRDTGYIQLYLWDVAGNLLTITCTTTGLNDGGWHQVMVSSLGTTAANGVKVYVDGLQDGQGTLTAGGIKAVTSNTPYALGNYSSTTPLGTTFSFNGRLNMFAMWDGTALDATDAANLYSGAEDPYSLGADVIPDFDNASFGSDWTIPDFNSGGDDWSSYQMEVGDLYTDAP